MAGVIHKIGETLNIGGKKDEHKTGDQHHGDQHCGDQHKVDQQYGEHKPEHYGDNKPEHYGEHKQEARYGEESKEGGGFMDKIKGKIPGVGGANKEGKKKKEKKKHEDGHVHGDSSSDSD